MQRRTLAYSYYYPAQLPNYTSVRPPAENKHRSFISFIAMSTSTGASLEAKLQAATSIYTKLESGQSSRHTRTIVCSKWDRVRTGSSN